ncbi:uncharacterized protein TNCV_543881 [Trichonephila clavipes]|nr:uncharacterized protein TNCV_543881 [Trichonephila clavipes]
MDRSVYLAHLNYIDTLYEEVKTDRITYGQNAAKERNSTFIETSAAINHQVDELLVSTLTQIRTKCKTPFEGAAPSRWSSPHYSLSKARGLIKKFLKKACFQSKSSDNLQRL